MNCNLTHDMGRCTALHIHCTALCGWYVIGECAVPQWLLVYRPCRRSSWAPSPSTYGPSTCTCRERNRTFLLYSVDSKPFSVTNISTT